MQTKYSPTDIENYLFHFWETHNLFIPNEEELKTQKTYTVLMPPPNVTNVLHLGHALNNTVQDVMVRYHRMMGYATIWKVGIDHAGIATQNVVEKELIKEGFTREEIGREEFLKRIWKWKEKYGSSIVGQLKKLGVSGDWNDLRFTMDDVSVKAVREIFVKLYNDGLIYRGEYIVNWCPYCLTALSDEEVEHSEISGQIYEIFYPLAESDEKVIVSTTRPETILGDVALAVNPQDDRYKHLIGKNIIIPIVGRTVSIVADERIEIGFGTGVLKITPANDALDFDIGKKYNLPIIEMLDEKGKMNELAGEHKGVDRFEYRKIFVKKLQENGFLSAIKNHVHSRGECYRCSTIIEPRVSKQWFVKMEKLALPALKAVQEHQVSFVPSKWEKVYDHWMVNIRDWCISRQIWWGHPIPAWHCKQCGQINVSLTDMTQCAFCGSENIKAETDVLDTWFSSWLWPLTTFGWPLENNQVDQFYPTQFLATAPEIIFFWVARMIMLGLYVKQEVPFKRVFFNATICDIKGRKMSKSLGNGIDPLEIIDLYGADSLRFTLLFVAPKGERIKIDMKSFEIGYKLANKLWNASRFILMMEGVVYNPVEFKQMDSWDVFILDSLNKVLKNYHKQIQDFDFHALTHTLYHFFWNDFCDWYIESSKAMLSSTNQNEKNQKYSFLLFLLEKIMTLFHPIMPFLTEEIWQKLPNKQGISIMKNSIPTDLDELLKNRNTEKDFIILIQEMIGKVRSIKADLNIVGKIDIGLYVSNALFRKEVEKERMTLILFTKSNSITFYREELAEQNTLSLAETDYILYIQFPTGFNKESEKIRLLKELEMTESEIKRALEKLKNKQFVESAATELVEEEVEKQKRYQEKKARLIAIIEQIS